MEQILARLLFSALEGNDETKGKVIKLLKFYRENRELIFLLLSAQGMQTANLNGEKTPAPEHVAENENAETENRPQEAVGSVSVLEEYLNRAV